MELSIKQIILICCLFFLQSCLSFPNKLDKSPRQFTLIAVNDIYNIEGVDARRSGGISRLRTLREQFSHGDEQALLLHAGDFLFPSSMSSQYGGEQMIDVMNQLDGSESGFDERLYVTFGNHEFDKGKNKYASLLADRIEQSDFYWLGSNVTLAEQATKITPDFTRSLQQQSLININGITVGLFSLTTNIAIPEYAEIDTNYTAIMAEQTEQLKAQGAEVVIAVTHLKISEDTKLLTALGDTGPDVIFGGHEHNRQQICVQQRCVIKADADLRSATVATITIDEQQHVTINHHYALLNDTTIDVDPVVEQRTNDWLTRYEKEYCHNQQLGSGCLRKVIGKTAVELVAEELEIRRYETNFGAYIAEQMLVAFDEIELPENKQVEVALINSGSLRLNQNIPANTLINTWYLNAIFQYKVSLRVVELSGQQLKAALAHSVEDWVGSGWWLQSAGIAFRHNVVAEQAQDIHLIDREGRLRLLKDNDRIVTVLSNYIANPAAGDQDGYVMLNLDNELDYGQPLLDLQQVVTKAINAQWQQKQSIDPVTPGRVCNSTRTVPTCLFDR